MSIVFPNLFPNKLMRHNLNLFRVLCLKDSSKLALRFSNYLIFKIDNARKALEFWKRFDYQLYVVLFYGGE